MSPAAHPPGEPAAGPARRGPYQGLIPYTEDDADWFFGRDAARAVVLDNLLAYRISILFGTSGVGKSSLLRAGVVRQVRDEGRRRIAEGEPPEYAALHFSSWAEDPVAGLQAAIRTALGDLSPPLAGGLPEGGSLADTVAAAALRVDGALLVILDQFEEYFLYHDADGPFITQLARLLARRETAASVLVAIREDSLAKLDVLTAHMPGLLDNLVRIEHLDRVAARAAITGPLELWNREQAPAGEEMRIEPELAEAVLDGVQTADARIQTPYLQIVLTRLWDDERAAGSRVLRLSTLLKLGGAERIVAEHVDNAIATLSPAEQAVAASVLRQLVTPSGTKIALRATDLAEYAGLGEPVVTAVLERLTREARILQAIGGGRYEIYHDALAQPILEWRRRWQASQDRLRERRRNRIVAAVATGLVLTVVVVATLAVLALRGQHKADREARDARAVALASASRDQVGTQPDIALLLGLAGLRERDRYETRNSLIAARQAAAPEAASGIVRGHTKTVEAVVFLQGGRKIVSAGDDGRVLVSDARTHRQIGRPLASDRGVGFLSLAISPDERLLAAGDDTGTIRLWEIGSRHLLRRAKTPSPSVDALAFSPDGRTLVGGGGDSWIRLWNAPALTPAGRSLKSPNLYVFGIAFSPDGRTIAAVGGGDAVRRWSVRTRRALPPLVRHRVRLLSVAFSPDGRTIATGGNPALLWNVATGRSQPMKTDARTAINGAVFSPDGRRLAGAGRDGETFVWDVGTRRLVRAPVGGPTGEPEGVAFSPDGRTVASFGGDAKIWLLDTRRPQLLVQPFAAQAVAFERAGQTLATAADDGLVRFWDLRSGRLVRMSRFDAEASSLYAFAPDAAALATGSPQGRVVAWDLKARRASATSLPGPAGEIGALAVSPTGDVVAAAAKRNRLTLWDAPSRRPSGRSLRGHRDPVVAVAFSPDGGTLASSDNREVRLWDLGAAGGPRITRVVKQAGVDALAFSRDGRTLALALDESGAIRLTRIATGGTSGLLPGGGSTTVLDIAFSPDGRMLIAGEEGTGAEIWDVAARRRLGAPIGPGDIVSHVAVSPDGTTLAGDGAGAAVRVSSHVIWQDEGDLRSEVCDLVGAGLSPGEWKQYAPGIDYRRVCDG